MADPGKPLRVLVLGAGGQIGRALLAEAPRGVEAVGLGHADLDIDDARGIAAALHRWTPDVVVNAAAHTDVDGAEGAPDLAYAINAAGPAKLAAAARHAGIRLVHLSTDFVFDGTAREPYSCDHPVAPLGVYGASKAAGEAAVRDILPDALIVRTAWVYAEEGRNFVLTMLRLMARMGTVRVVADQIGTPTHARSFAGGLWALIRHDVRGTWHLTDGGVASWHDMAVAIGEEAFAIGLPPRRPVIEPIPSVEFPTPARRPAYSVLDCSATWRELGRAAPPWREELWAMLAGVRAHAGQERQHA